MHALIIEDQALIAMMLEDELWALGFTSFDVATTQDGAIAAARRRCPDLITADDRLTTGSGIDAVRIICAEQSIPTVFIVGDPHELRRRLPDTIVVGKPFLTHDLFEAIERAVLMVGKQSACWLPYAGIARDSLSTPSLGRSGSPLAPAVYPIHPTAG